jgi:ATP synthase protein I
MLSFIETFTFKFVNLTEHPPQTPPLSDREPDGSAQDSASAMHDYYRLKRDLLIVTVVATVVIFGSVYFFYSLNTALNYLLGACTGVVYLSLLARDVERLGSGSKGMGGARLALFVVVIVLAMKIQPLEVIPVFLGFLTYKLTLIFYTIRSTIPRS